MAKNKQVKHRDKKASKRSRIFAALIAFIMVAALGIFVWKVALPELSRANSDTQEITAGQQVTLLFQMVLVRRKSQRFFLRTRLLQLRASS